MDMEEEDQTQQQKTSRSPPPPHRQILEGWLNKSMKIKMSDSRTIVGVFLCTDCHRNIILGSSLEYLKDEESEEPRMLGLAMIPGEHVVSIQIDDFLATEKEKHSKSKHEEKEEEYDEEEDVKEITES